MIKHRLTQGQPDWHQFRQAHFGSSETAAMLGISPYLNRNALLDQKLTGKSKEYSDWVQKNILDYGHDVEASAREIIEAELDDDLFPITCSDGEISASCDGLTLDGKIALEHKQYNRESFGMVQNGEVPEHHMPQCQQILMVTGAEKLIFVVSDGTKENMASVEVFPDQSWFGRIRSGWNQFKIDLANYKQREIAEKPEPAAIMQLPALSIQIKGEVTLSNLPQFKEAAETYIANINTDLKTDDDFVNAEATVKFCGETEDKLEAAKAAAIGQTASIDELMRTIDHIKESIRQKRLTLEKLVKSQKESIKESIIDDAFIICDKHDSELNSEFIKYINFDVVSYNLWGRHSFVQACKNKRTLASLHNAVDTEVAAIKIKLDDLARVIRKNLTLLPEDLSLFRDLQSIITKTEDDFKLIVDTRISEHKRKLEEEKQRAVEAAKAAFDAQKIAEEKAKADQLAAEERGRAQAAAAAERDRLAREQAEKKVAPAPSNPPEDAKAVETAPAPAPSKIKNIKTTPEQKAILAEVIDSMIDFGVEEKAARNVTALIFAQQIKHVSINFFDQPTEKTA